jgi:hypothetical protein
MSLEGIVSIAGFGGLFKVISSNKNGIIVESIEDKKRMLAYSHYKISALSEISIYTQSDNTALADVLKNIYKKENKGKVSIDVKDDPKTLKKYFKEILPEYDEERVYFSDIKKIISWYNILHSHDMLPVNEEIDTNTKEETVEASLVSSTEVETDPKPKKSTRKKSSKKSTSDSEA